MFHSLRQVLLKMAICLCDLMSNRLPSGIAFAAVAIIALVVFIYNVSDGLRKAKDEMERMQYLDNSEYDYGHNVKHHSYDE